jgi:thiol-disulfide isomerase/thioredoxin
MGLSKTFIGFSFLLCITIVLFSCNKRAEKRVVVNFTIDYPVGDSEIVKVNKYTEFGNRVIDTLVVIDSLNLQFSTIIRDQSLFHLRFANHPFKFILTKDDEVVNIVLKDGSYAVEGSEQTNIMMQMDKLVRETADNIYNLSDKAEELEKAGDLQSMDSVLNEFNTYQFEGERKIKNLIRKAGPSFVSLYGLSHLSMEKDLRFFEAVVDRALEAMPNHFYARQLELEVGGMRTSLSNSIAPEIVLNDTSGELVKLTSLKGKHILVYFWASWCETCKEESDNIARLSKKYGRDKLEVYAVSLDRRKEAWLSAIDDTNQNWVNVSELKYFQSEACALYKVNSIPYTCLIDPKGKIIGRNLLGDKLENGLAKLFEK